MALDINGYNDTFRAFTEFATKNVDAGKGKANCKMSIKLTLNPAE